MRMLEKVQTEDRKLQEETESCGESKIKEGYTDWEKHTWMRIW